MSGATAVGLLALFCLAAVGLMIAATWWAERDDDDNEED